MNENKILPGKEDLALLEFHRHGYALLPHADDRRPGVAFWVDSRNGRVGQGFCTCAAAGNKACNHKADLKKLVGALRRQHDLQNVDEKFRASIWYRLAVLMAEQVRVPVGTVEFRAPAASGRKYLKAFDGNGRELLTYFSAGPDRSRFLERCRGMDEADISSRSEILGKLMLLTQTPAERQMIEQGYKTRGQVVEESFWFRVAYHGFRECGVDGCLFRPAVEENSGNFTLTCQAGNGEDFCRFVVPRLTVQSLLAGLREYFPNQHGMSIHPIPLRSIFNVAATTELDLEIRPLIKLVRENGEKSYYESEDLQRFRYGNLVFLREAGILAELERPDSKREFRAPIKMVIKKTQVPSFLEEMGDELRQDSYIVAEPINKLRFFRQADRVTMTAEALSRDWCWLSVMYGFGNTEVSLVEILQTRQAGQRYIATAEGWIDCQAESLAGLTILADPPAAAAGKNGALKLSRLDLLRLRATMSADPDLAGEQDQIDWLARLLDLKPAAAFAGVRGMTSSLRHYQKLGVEWLLFLFENHFGGLLCDDMGLGKTHQIMAFWTYLQENGLLHEPCLLVCPTTVLSHWEKKLQEHAPALKASVYYGSSRNLEDALAVNDILLTSYGVLQRDGEQLGNRTFAVAVFDEMQYLKNPATLTYRAARRLKSGIKLGLTGTPIENTLAELKALLDLVAPRYLGSDEDFHNRYVAPLAESMDNPRREELQRLISPFILRRLKCTVLEELPPKIEDIRTCRLSEDQVKLYRDALAARAGDLLEVLKEDQKPVPYIHVFALLNLLKQICNHSALVQGAPADYQRHGSGKWDLFAELLAESLDSGQKVVVYSQFLGMIRIIENYLTDLGVGFVSLTGASRKRGDIISRFNSDPDCRVFVGSLKAGGAGIDLVAASVVIHYDRWWNAAREDQATDRLHRIGQKRGVQVFKLLTLGTLEEKIAAIIQKKRDLMDRIVQEDDPGLLKSFNREQLLEMLTMPVG